MRRKEIIKKQADDGYEYSDNFEKDTEDLNNICLFNFYIDDIRHLLFRI